MEAGGSDIFEAASRSYGRLFFPGQTAEEACKSILRGAMRIGASPRGSLLKLSQSGEADCFLGGLDPGPEGKPGRIVITRAKAPLQDPPAGSGSLVDLPLGIKFTNFGAIRLALPQEGEEQARSRLALLHDFAAASSSLLKSLESAGVLERENALLKELSQSIHLLLMVGQVPGEVAKLSLEEGLRLAGCGRGAFLIKDPATGAFELMADKGMSDEARAAYAAAPLTEEDNTLALNLLMKKEPMVPSDLAGHPALAAFFPAGLRHFFCLPITGGDELLGILMLGGGTELPQSARVQLAAFLQLFADQAGLAVRNSLLYRQLSDKQREFEGAAESLIQSEKLAMAGRMAAAVAHQVRNPLSVIGAHTQIMMGRLIDDDPQRADFQLILQKIGEADKAIRDLMDLAKPLLVKSELRNLGASLQAIQKFLLPRCQAQKVELKLALVAGLPEVWVDEMQFQRAFLDLCLHSLKSLPEGATLVVAAAGFGTRVELRVEDDGPGIPADALPSIFEPFYLTKGKGGGLGLYNVKRLCSAMGVELEAANLHPHGASYRFSFPVSKEKPAALVPAVLAEKASRGGIQ